jgi:hypothetical protein
MLGDLIKGFLNSVAMSRILQAIFASTTKEKLYEVRRLPSWRAKNHERISDSIAFF